MAEEKDDVPSKFSYRQRKDKHACIFKITEGTAPVTWRRFIELTSSKDQKFTIAIQAAIKSTGFKYIFLNCPPLSKTTLDKEFEMAVLEASWELENIETDMDKFRDKFKGKKWVASFYNLGLDAVLVSPFAREDQDKKIYSSLGPFIWHAPDEQQVAVWHNVGMGLGVFVKRRTVWLNTEGRGVHYLHLRLDSRPKYYRYNPFKNINYYGDEDDSG